MTPPQQQILILQPFVKAIAGTMRRRLPPCVETDDLISVGNVAVLENLPRFDQRRGSLKGFLFRRIRGAMLDYLRESDPVSRDMRARAKRLEFTYGELERISGRPPSDEQAAKRLRVSLRRLNQWLSTLNRQGVEVHRRTTADRHLPLQPPESFDGGPSPFEFVAQQECIGLLAGLPARQKTVVQMMYFEGMQQNEVAGVFGCHESRVSQLHRQAISRLRAKVALVPSWRRRTLQ